jgi:type IV pilus assembly protein PilW
MNPRNKMHRTSRRRTRGFSLVELMVASTIGLILTLAVTGAVMTTGRQFSVVAANVAAQGSAQIALSLLDAGGRSAGAGFYSNGQLVCPTWNAWNGSTVVSNGAAFMPARIVSGASSAVSDTVIFTGSAAVGALSALPVMADAAAGAVVSVSNAGGLASGDLALIGVPGSTQPCTLFQVTPAPALPVGLCGVNATSCSYLTRAVNASFNPPVGTFTNNPTFGFETVGSTLGPAVVSRIGSSGTGLRQDAFGVQCNALVRFNAFINGTVPICIDNPLSFGTGVDAIAADVVLMRAQYGISNAASSDVVTAWVPASGATWGATPTVANVARIKAVRVVLVTRSKEADGAQISSACTNAGAVVNTGPCSFQDADAPVIDLSGTAVAVGKTWKNYRYRVHQAVIPLRNVIWSDS